MYPRFQINWFLKCLHTHSDPLFSWRSTNILVKSPQTNPRASQIRQYTSQLISNFQIFLQWKPVLFPDDNLMFFDYVVGRIYMDIVITIIWRILEQLWRSHNSQLVYWPYSHCLTFETVHFLMTHIFWYIQRSWFAEK